MCHRAYAFDWARFEVELLDLLERALAAGDLGTLFAFVDEHRSRCRDPYEGEPLSAEWRGRLETDGIQELADFALTKYYDPSDDCGVQELWTHIDNELPDNARAALLGFVIGPLDRRFDPGKMGSYFQTPSMVRSSLLTLAPYNCAELQKYLSLLSRTAETGVGMYVTF